MSGRYVPRKANASIQEHIPEAYAPYTKPAIRSPNEIRVEADLKTRAEQAKLAAEKAATSRVRQVKKPIKATIAFDKVTRMDRLKGAIEDIEQKIPKGKVKDGLLEESKEFDATIHAPVTEEEGDETREVPNPLGTFADEQKRTEENPGQYALETEVYMPSTRTGFYKFIKDTYANRFTIKGNKPDPDPKACEKLLQTGDQAVTAFIYQDFIKEYLRQASPYRGLLVYHGLGSGKTCSAIAAAESLYGIANKKIIVMTPQSLRNNFIKEISFCGFRHYSRNNHWTKHNLVSLPSDRKVVSNLLDVGDRVPLIKNMLLMLYGLSVLSLPYDYLLKLIKRTEVAYNENETEIKRGIKTLDQIPANNNAFLWIPDYSKKPNFNELSPIEKDMVRMQIAETVRNRFEFISYNGITNAKLLALACDKTHPFDNAVIVIDEIHNLIRLMQGDIEPYLLSRPDKKRKITPEPVGVGHWSPLLCNSEEKYSRGYLFYRLLTGARNSKIVGLSGTPIINVPEEIGIMANLIAGYIDTVKINIGTGNSRLAVILEGMANMDLRVDYVRRSSGTASQTVMISIFNEGYIKVLEDDGKTFKGVIHSNEPVAQASIGDVYKRLTAAFLKEEEVLRILKDLSLSSGTILTNPQYMAYPRLPPDMDTFRGQFIDLKTLGIKKENELVLKKRLTGIVSYYRRARPEFFPEIGLNELVECELSEHALGVYSVEREKEIDAEEKKKDRDPVGELFSVVEKFSKGKSPSSYRFASRAACNYAFPGVLSKTLVIKRPYPSSAKEYAKEVAPVKDTTEAAPIFVPEEAREPPIQELDKGERDIIRIHRNQTTLEGIPEQYDGLTVPEQEIILGWRDGADERKQKETEAQIAQEEARAKLGVGEEEQEGGAPEPVINPIPYQTLLRDALDKLIENSKTLFALDDQVNGLKKYSCKLYKILKKMEESKGPILMYSQYKTVEGLGVFAIALRANGYEQIKFKMDNKPWQPIEFDEASIASFKKGPGIKRFITFSGEEDQRQRSAILAIFNGQWQELTRSIRSYFMPDETKPEKERFDGNLPQSKFVRGEIISCIGITGAGAEGISLRNVRQVHIMEPFWNMARLEQVKGRAIRVCSHADLPIADRKVDIYTYVSIFSPGQLATGMVSTTIKTKDKGLTSDEIVLEVATRKQAISNQLLKVLQEVSVDCDMNLADNYQDQEPLECFKYKVTDMTRDPFMFDPDLDTDKINTKSKLQATTTTPHEKGALRLLEFVYKGNRYIKGDWIDGESYAFIYKGDAAKSGAPISTWQQIGRVYRDPSRDGQIGIPEFYSADFEEGEEEGGEGEEEGNED